MAQLIFDSGKHLSRLTENFLLYTQIQILQDNAEKLEDLKKEILKATGRIKAK